MGSTCLLACPADCLNIFGEWAGNDMVEAGPSGQASSAAVSSRRAAPSEPSGPGSEFPKQPNWGLFGHSVEDIRTLLPRDLVAAQAEMFLVSGDMNSNLYTSSRAMHSAIIGLLQVPCLLGWCCCTGCV